MSTPDASQKPTTAPPDTISTSVGQPITGR